MTIGRCEFKRPRKRCLIDGWHIHFVHAPAHLPLGVSRSFGFGMRFRVGADAGVASQRLYACQKPRLVLAIGHHDAARYITRGVARPRFQHGSAFLRTVIVSIEEDEDTGAVGRAHSNSDGALQIGSSRKLGAPSPMRSRNLHGPGFGLHGQSPEQNRSRGYVTLAFDDRLDDHRTLSNNRARGASLPMVGADSRAFARSNSPAPMRRSRRAVRFASDTGATCVAPACQSTIRR